MKTKKMIELEVDPLVFQSYMCVVVAIICFITLSFTDVRFSWWGVLGATMWTMCQIMAFIITHEIGYARGLAIWAGVTVLVGFIIGVVAFDQKLLSLAGCIVGVFVLICGIVAIAMLPDYLMNRDLAQKTKDIQQKKLLSFDENASQLDEVVAEGSVTNPECNYEEESERSFEPEKPVPITARGVALAVFMGCLNGSVMVPLHFFSEEQNLAADDPDSISYLFSFGIGVLICTPVLFALWFLLFKREKPQFHFWDVIGPATICGTIWSFGYIAATYSTIFLGQAIGYPLSQAAILVAGSWGVFYFKEITGTLPIIAFFASGGLILAGVVVMAVFGQEPVHS